nr:PHP domain-containing protein [Fulvivirga sedimenti]
MRTTGPENHLKALGLGTAPYKFSNEEAAYKKAGYPFIPPDVRIAPDILHADPSKIENLIAEDDIRGILHAHSTYSDGQYSIKEMVEACRKAGYSYLGMTDHSKSSFFYANGLFENRVQDQFREIDQLQQEYPDFKIFKGIECDILSDGSLDYTNEFLEGFDFIIISVHSVLHMDIKTATARLVKAIENPFSTILGHLSGRLLLRRQGYPLHMPTILDACRDNGVSIEINANPRRLDIDWSYLPEVLERNIKISINPDAHNIKGINDVKFGVMAARKGLVTPADNLTSLPADELTRFFSERKAKSIQKVSHEH